MTENIILIILGTLISIIGILNCTGHIETIHRYNRTRITEETRRPYGIFMGIGTLILSVSLIACAVLDLIFNSDYIYFGVAAGALVSVALMLFAQFKYNKGIF